PVTQAWGADVNAGGVFSPIAFNIVKQFATGSFHARNGLAGGDLTRHLDGQGAFRQIIDDGPNGKTGDQQLIQTDNTTGLQVAIRFGDRANWELPVSTIRSFDAHIPYQTGGPGGGSQQTEFFCLCR